MAWRSGCAPGIEGARPARLHTEHPCYGGLCGGRLSSGPWCGKRHLPGGDPRTVAVRRSRPSKAKQKRNVKEKKLLPRPCGTRRRRSRRTELDRRRRCFARGDGPGGRFRGRDARHSGLVRCLGRVFGNQGTVERDGAEDTARKVPRGGGFRIGSGLGTVAARPGKRGWRRSRRDESDPPRLDREADQQRLSRQPVSWMERAHSRSSRGSGSGSGDQ